MLTLFAVPKPFRGHIDVIQRNAIQSWLQFRPELEIILFGDEEGTADIATKFDVRHVPDVERNEYGTPLVRDLFAESQVMASNNLLCYINADIILTSDFLPVVQRVRKRRRFLVVGQRWDVDLDKPWDFDKPDWEVLLRSCVGENGELHPATGIDYFMFPKGLWGDIPPFVVGRPVWDNWLVYWARLKHIPVIDATHVITAVHQNHDYSHVVGGTKGFWEGPERRRNFELAGGYLNMFTMKDATWILTHSGIWPAVSPERIDRHLETLPQLFPGLSLWLKLLRTGWMTTRPLLMPTFTKIWR